MEAVIVVDMLRLLLLLDLSSRGESVNCWRWTTDVAVFCPCPGSEMHSCSKQDSLLSYDEP